MSDIKLFRMSATKVTEQQSKSATVERSLQVLIERHLDAFLSVRFLDTEYSTGKTHGGRIDTLGIDEDDSPVIIEYKRATNENVINQGLYISTG
jgi:RecB family endonuclease NucS